jgi:hypothetical protein
MDIKRAGVVIGLVGLLVAAAPGRVRACGGFFCNQAIPIDQSGEQIVFSIEANRITAHILIQFQGNARDFAWVVPVMSKPQIKLGTQALFLNLLRQTQPQFRVDAGPYAQCSSGSKGVMSARADGGVANAGPGVTVLETREVGPFATAVLESTDASELVQWLKDNGYDQPAESTPLIEHYVKQRMLFVALKLKQDATTGEIQPLVLEMPHTEACVPLILTRVAAVANMPVQVFVLGPHRAVPRNWFNVEINQKRIDWLANGRNYRQLVTEAIDEAAGRGFVTEYAGDTGRFAGSLYVEGRFDLTALRATTDAQQLIQLALALGLPRDAVLLALLAKYAPMPQQLRQSGVTEAQFYGNPLYQSALAGVTADGAAFAAELEQRIITPLREAQALLDGQPYLTRMYATVSPDEMTRDPLFQFNPDLPRVSNLHVARAVGGTCASDGSIAGLILELEDGTRMAVDGAVMRPLPFGRPVEAAGSGPAAARIQLVGSHGAPTSYESKQAFIVDQALDRDTPELVREMNPPFAARSSGCALGGGAPAPLALGALAAVALAIAGRRRRR